VNLRQTILFLFSAAFVSVSAAPATVTNTVQLAEADWDWVRNELVVRSAAQLDAESPRYKKGDEMKIRLVTGTDINGQFDFASDSYFIVIRNKAESRQPFIDLDPSDRVRIDPSFREATVKIEALLQARAIFAAASKVKEPEPREKPTWDDLMKNGTTAEMNTEARRIMKTWSLRNPGPLDPGHAAVIFSGLAPADPEAAYALGTMIFNGAGIRKNGELSLNLISHAAKAGVSESYRFLDRFKVESYRRDGAAKAGADWLAKQKSNLLLHKDSILALKAERETRRKETLGIKDAPPVDPKTKK
jgi:hypothetical protein